MAATLHIHLRGDFCLLYDETPVTALKTASLQSLLAYLVVSVMHPNHVRSSLCASGPISTEPQAHTNLRNLLHHLRPALPKADQFLQAGAGAVGWRGDRLPTCYEDWIPPEREE